MLAALLIGAYAIPYAVRTRSLAARGRPIPAWRIWCFAAGMATLVLAVSPPVLDLAGSRFAAHMAEHLLIADMAGCSSCWD